MISFLLISMAATVCYIFVDIIGYQVVALILLLVVSILAMLFDILPVLLTALLSALIWNFFFIPPVHTFHVGTPEDVLMFLMYFVVAMINAVMTFKIRQVERKDRIEKEKVKSIKLYNTLLNSLSHELRTPISTIIGAIDTIIAKEVKLSEAHKTELFHEIEKAGNRLNRQVENLLSMSRLESGFLKPKLDWCDVNELVYNVIRTNKNESQNHMIGFEPNENLPLFKTDRGLLEQIIYNIAHNSIQHTPENTQITVAVEAAGGICKISIADNGPGFPENEINLVFNKFYRLSGTRAGGTGLGLSISKGFTEVLGGSLLLRNKTSGGAEFQIQIPAETSSIDLQENE